MAEAQWGHSHIVCILAGSSVARRWNPSLPRAHRTQPNSRFHGSRRQPAGSIRPRMQTATGTDPVVVPQPGEILCFLQPQETQEREEKQWFLEPGAPGTQGSLGSRPGACGDGASGEGGGEAVGAGANGDRPGGFARVQDNEDIAAAAGLERGVGNVAACSGRDSDGAGANLAGGVGNDCSRASILPA